MHTHTHTLEKKNDRNISNDFLDRCSPISGPGSSKSVHTIHKNPKALKNKTVPQCLISNFPYSSALMILITLMNLISDDSDDFNGLMNLTILMTSGQNILYILTVK